MARSGRQNQRTTTRRRECAGKVGVPGGRHFWRFSASVTKASLPTTSSLDKLVTEHLPAIRILLERPTAPPKSTAFLFLK
jgi:hypothetical protein